MFEEMVVQHVCTLHADTQNALEDCHDLETMQLLSI